MITVTRAADLAAHVDKELGVSSWVLIDRQSIAAFGQITRDTHWIHMDDERAGREAPFGGVIAHGFLLLSMITGLANECYSVERAGRWINYGLDRVRFTAPVTAGSRVRLRLVLRSVEAVRSGTKLTLSCTVEIDGNERAAAVCDWICIATDEDS